MQFTLDKDGLTKLSTFLDNHNKTCKYYDDGTSLESKSGAIGGRLTYAFTPTSLGVITVIKCACGAEVNVTDFDSW